MKNNAMKLLAVLALCSGPAFAQSTVEKAKAGAKDVKRDVKKSAHRVGEDLCMGTKAECAKKKAQNRISETKEAIEDGADELKDKVDSNGT